MFPNNANTITTARAMVDTATVVEVNAATECLVELLAVAASALATARNIIAIEEIVRPLVHSMLL